MVDTIYCRHIKKLKILERSLEINIHTHSRNSAGFNLITNVEIMKVRVFRQNNINIENSKI